MCIGIFGIRYNVFNVGSGYLYLNERPNIKPFVINSSYCLVSIKLIKKTKWRKHSAYFFLIPIFLLNKIII